MFLHTCPLFRYPGSHFYQGSQYTWINYTLTLSGIRHSHKTRYPYQDIDIFISLCENQPFLQARKNTKQANKAPSPTLSSGPRMYTSICFITLPDPCFTMESLVDAYPPRSISGKGVSGIYLGRLQPPQLLACVFLTFLDALSSYQFPRLHPQTDASYLHLYFVHGLSFVRDSFFVHTLLFIYSFILNPRPLLYLRPDLLHSFLVLQSGKHSLRTSRPLCHNPATPAD
jgi:hypothetical protein